MRRMKCQHCNGSGGARYFEVGDEGVPGPSRPVLGKCHVCNGEGRLSELHTYLMLAGNRLRQYREKRGLSAYHLAKELGIEPGDVQSMERGMFSLACVIRGYAPEHREIIYKLIHSEP
jgi:DNA-binding XRE family transcriptional regulator